MDNSTYNEQTQKFKFATIGVNGNGSRIFCKLSYNRKSILRGYYDFNLERFVILRYQPNNFNGLSKTQVKKALKQELLNYDWEA